MLCRKGVLVFVASLLLLQSAACTSSTRPYGAVQIEPARDLERRRFAAGRELLSGEVEPRSGERWHAGDTVLLGIALDAGSTRTEWYLRATALGPVSLEIDGTTFNMRDSVRVRRAGEEGAWVRIEYDMVRVLVELFDSQGRPLSKSTALMPELCLQYGLYEYIEQSLAGQDAFASGPVQLDASGELIAGEELRRAVAGWIAIMKLPDFLQRDSGMDQLIWRIIDRPGLLSIFAYRGIQMEVGLNGKDAEPEIAGAVSGPAYRVPVDLTLNGRRAVRCEIVVTRGDPPLGPCNGLLAMDAVHPSDPSRRMAVRLLAARRGEVKQTSQSP